MKPTIFSVVLLSLFLFGCAGTPPSTTEHPPQPEPQPVQPVMARFITMKVTAPSSNWTFQIGRVIQTENDLVVAAVLKEKQPRKSEFGVVTLEDSVMVFAPLLPLKEYIFTPILEEEFVRLGNSKERHVSIDKTMLIFGKYKELPLIRGSD